MLLFLIMETFALSIPTGRENIALNHVDFVEVARRSNHIYYSFYNERQQDLQCEHHKRKLLTLTLTCLIFIVECSDNPQFAAICSSLSPIGNACITQLNWTMENCRKSCGFCAGEISCK